MNLTRERKILLAIVGLGGLAVAVDRLVLESGHSGPQSAAAEMAVPAGDELMPSDAEGIMRATLALLSDDRDGPLLSERLTGTAAAHGVSPLEPRDAFTPAPSWVQPNTPQRAGPAAPQAEDPADIAEHFRQRHRLDAVMTDHGAGVAIVNGRTLRVGQTLDGFTLTRVGHRSVEFAAGAMRVELQVREQ